MTTLDGVLGLVLAVGVWRGLQSGGLRQLAQTAGWVVGFVAATALMKPVGDLVALSLGVSDRTGPVLGFVVVFGGVVLVLGAAAHVARKTLEAVKLGVLDRAAGGGLGGLRAAFGLSVVLLVTGFAPTRGAGPILVSEDAREASVLYEPIQALAPDVWGIVRTATPGLQAALVDKFHTWQAGRPERETGEAPLE